MSEPVKDYGFERTISNKHPHVTWADSRKDDGDFDVYVDAVVVTIDRQDLLTDEARRFAQLLQLAIRIHEQLAAGVKIEDVEFGKEGTPLAKSQERW